MDQKSTIELMRLLHGELDEVAARRLRERIAASPELKARYTALESQWLDLQMPEPVGAPPGFSGRVLARAKERAGAGWAPSWWSGTLIGRFASIAVLAGGIVAGVMLVPVNGTDAWSEYTATDLSMAETYLVAMQDSTEEQWLEGGQ